MTTKVLTQKQKQILRKTIVKMKLPNGHLVAYTLVNKQSKTGFSSNERLFLLHSGQRSIRYYKNIPPTIPFTSPEQIIEGKQKVHIDNVNKFKCEQIKGKNSTMMIEWELKGEKSSWIFGMGTPKIMNEWIYLIQQMIEGKLGKEEQDRLKEEQQKARREKERLQAQERERQLQRERQKQKQEQERIRRLEEQERIRRLQEEERRRRLQEEEKLRFEAQRIRQEEERIQRQEEDERRKRQERLFVIKQRQIQEQQRKRRQQISYEQSIREDERRKVEKRRQEQSRVRMSRNQERLHESQNRSQVRRVDSSEQSFFLNRTSEALKKVDSKYFRKQQVENIRWNEIWCEKYSLDIYEQFIHKSTSIAHEIIEQLPLLKGQRKYAPLQINSPFSLYVHEGITYKVHCFSDEISILEKQGRKDDPLLFDQSTYEEAKRQFYNFNYIISITGNRGFIKVPLCHYVQYKGVLVVCKASMPQQFQKVFPQQFQKQLQALEQVLKLRFSFNSLLLHLQPDSKYLLISELSQLIPKMLTKESSYYRRQLLLQSQSMMDSRTSILELQAILNKSIIPEFVQRLQSLEFWVIQSSNLVMQLHKMGIGFGCLGQVYFQTTSIYYKKIFASQMANHAFTNILRSQINNVISHFPASEIQNLSYEIVDKILLDCIHILIDELFSYSSKSEAIWRVMVKQIKQIYDIVISKEDILPGYLLGAILHRNGILCDFKSKQFNRDVTFFVKQSTISRNVLLGFRKTFRKYNLQAMSPQLEAVGEILSDPPSPDNFENLVKILQLRRNEIPFYCSEIKEEILAYMCNFIPFGDHDQYEHLALYDSLQMQPHTFFSSKISLLAIKWAIKQRKQELANQIFEIKFEQNIFWVSQFNPAISEFYDFFSLYYASVANYDQSVKLAKSSLINIIKVIGANSLPVSDKHYQLGNIFFKIGKKQESLKQYSKTKQILEQHKQTNIPEYGVILLKLSTLYLNFGKIVDCVSYALENLKIIDGNGGNPNDEIQTFEILSRAYEITRKKADLVNVGALCMQKFNLTENPKIFERMMKIALFPRLTSLHPHDSKALFNILTKLQSMESPLTYMEAFSYMHHRAQDQIVMKRVFSYLDNVNDLNQEISRRDLYRRHRSLNYETQSEGAEMLVMMETVATMVGYNFLIGCLRENFHV